MEQNIDDPEHIAFFKHVVAEYDQLLKAEIGDQVVIDSMKGNYRIFQRIE